MRAAGSPLVGACPAVISLHRACQIRSSEVMRLRIASIRAGPSRRESTTDERGGLASTTSRMAGRSSNALGRDPTGRSVAQRPNSMSEASARLSNVRLTAACLPSGPIFHPSPSAFPFAHLGLVGEDLHPIPKSKRESSPRSDVHQKTRSVRTHTTTVTFFSSDVRSDYSKVDLMPTRFVRRFDHYGLSLSG